MYDALSADYDRFVNWQNRLAIELPFIIQKLQESNARSVLDAATGTGMHAIALAQCGFITAGADLSRGMIKRAAENARSSGVEVRFEEAGFGGLAHVFGNQSFDAVTCLGNSLPHLLSPRDLSTAIMDFATCLMPGGLLLIQNRNFDAIMARHDRWMEPQSYSEGDTQWVFQRFYDFDSDGLLTINMVTLKRIGQANWSQSIASSRLRPILKEELVSILDAVGFSHVTCFGNMAGAAFDPDSSPNLIITASAA